MEEALAALARRPMRDRLADVMAGRVAEGNADGVGDQVAGGVADGTADQVTVAEAER
ncbi:hypothetical protein ACLGI4_15230 [Streptomyces sp. HMX112]|uniref:hypothetical protein n=1 Tax=Streptomyces sp. HMX112 TaxID=3390850 RepID=UPI003A7FAADD